MAVDLSTILTREQKQRLASIIEILDELIDIAKAAQACEMECSDWASTAANMKRKAKLLLDNFGDRKEP